MGDDELAAIINSIIDARLEDLAQSSTTVPFHKHTGTNGDGPQLPGVAIVNAPQGITAFSGGTLSSGGATGLTNADSAILTSLIASNTSMYNALKTLGLLK